jgi:hypothetical protein
MAQKMRLVPETMYNKIMSTQQKEITYEDLLKHKIQSNLKRRNYPAEIKARLVQQNNRHLYNKRMMDAKTPLLVNDIALDHLFKLASKKRQEDETEEGSDTAEDLPTPADQPVQPDLPTQPDLPDLPDLPDYESDRSEFGDVFSDMDVSEPPRNPRPAPPIKRKPRQRTRRVVKVGDKRVRLASPDIEDKRPRDNERELLVRPRKRTQLNPTSGARVTKQPKWSTLTGEKRHGSPISAVPAKKPRQRKPPKRSRQPTRQSARIQRWKELNMNATDNANPPSADE